MCGIVGYIGQKKIVPILMGGLEKLEYRGYDSSGLACLDKNGDSIAYIKRKGKLQSLKASLNNFNPIADLSVGIGHTRWATHGVPSQANSHPHLDKQKEFAVVQNGIIENYVELKAGLIKKGYRFSSETDTEVLPHLIHSYYKGNFLEAFQKAILKLKGFFALVVISKHQPDVVLAFRRSNPLVIGVGKNENFLASDMTPLLAYTKRAFFPDDDQIVQLGEKQIKVFRLKDLKPVRPKVITVKWNVEQAEKGGYPHFMLKEIYEQPEVARLSLIKRIKNNERIVFEKITKKAELKLKKIQKIFAVSCGTAYHAGMVGKYLIEDFAKIPVECWVSSEFRYADPIVGPDDVVVFITQSGETADTLAALREAKRKGAFTISICNVVGSTIDRESDVTLHTNAGPEIGVASTKAYISQLICITLFALYMGKLRRRLDAKTLKKHIKLVQRIPNAIESVLGQDALIKRTARKLAKSKNYLYLARGYNYPTALEGTLKLQEITYVHAHGYAAGEMKHGPIALIDKKLPVVCICPESATYDKMISNVEEIRARGGILITVTTAKDKRVKKHAVYNFEIPKVPEYLSPILTILPLQLLAYYIAVFNNRDVDQPRNLAKSVTVE
jgi:glucosamine--fructose-6-phosphate aminotransferase (isomerizing)